MNKEKDFFKTCFDTVAGLEVKNESQAIAKEVILDEVENLQQRIDKGIEFLDKVREENGNEIGQVNYETLIEILGGKNEDNRFA